MQTKGTPQIGERKGTRLYRCCRTTTTVFLTLILLIPAIYLLGAQDSYHQEKPLYTTYQNNHFYQLKIEEVQNILQGKDNILAVNLHCQYNRVMSLGERTRNWENLIDFTDYLGYSLNLKGISTVSQTISLPQIKQKRNKKQLSPESIKSLEESYKLSKFGSVNTMKTKLNKLAANIIKKLKVQLTQPTTNNWLEQLRYQFIQNVHSSKVWLIVIEPKNMENNSSELLKKQLIALGKERPRDKFIVVSQWPVDPANHRIKQVIVKINEEVLIGMRPEIQPLILRSLNLSEANYPKTTATVLCKTNGSLLQLNNFIFNCKHSNCLTYLDLLVKKKLKKLEKNEQYTGISKAMRDLCEKGTPFSEQDWDLYAKALGVGYEKDIGEEFLKYYYELANGDICKSQKSCNAEWLYFDKTKNENIAKVSNDSITKQADQVPNNQSSQNNTVYQKQTSQTETIEPINQQQTQQPQEGKQIKNSKQQQQVVSQGKKIKKNDKERSHHKTKKSQSKKTSSNKSKNKQKKGKKSVKQQETHQELISAEVSEEIKEDTKKQTQIEENKCVDDSCQSDSNDAAQTASLSSENNDSQNIHEQGNSLNIQIQGDDQQEEQIIQSQSTIQQTDDSNKQFIQTVPEEQEQTIQLNQNQENTIQQTEQIPVINPETQQTIATDISQQSQPPQEEAVQESDQ